MSVLHGPGHLGQQGGGQPLAARKESGRLAKSRSPALLLGPLGQVPSGKVLHAEVEQARRLAEFIKGDDAGMSESANGLGLRQEALSALGVGQLGTDGLEGHQAVERALPGLVDHPHPAPGNLFQQIVITETPRRRSSKRCRRRTR